MRVYIIKLLLATACGAVIGYERKNRNKEAGLRTHIIVAIGACLMMIVSKYGFMDMDLNVYKVDVSRIASGVVSGVGFLGAGMILIRKNTISGLSTAAGIWTTSGIGLAIGAGMYEIGIFTTVLVVGLQYILHWSGWSDRIAHHDHIYIEVASRADIKKCNDFLENYGIRVVEFSFDLLADDTSVGISYNLIIPNGFVANTFMEAATEQPYIRSAEFNS